MSWVAKGPLVYEMKWNGFFLIKFTTISGNTWKQNTRKRINYLTFMIKKYKESKIVKKYLRWKNLLVVAWDKCNNDIKRENSTGSLSIINRAYIAGPKWDGIPFSGMIKLKLKFF